MKNLTNKFILSVLSLVLTGVALSAGVYAWLTINNTAKVETFEASVQTVEGFYVSLDGSTWTNTITASQIQTAIGDVTLKVVTSEDGINLTDLAGTVAPAGSYIEFDLFFLSSADTIGVNLASLDFVSNATSWVPGIAVDGTASEGNANGAITGYASNAARISFHDIATANAVAVTYEEKVGENGNTKGKGGFATNAAVLFYNAIMTPAITEQQFDDANLATTLPFDTVNQQVATMQANNSSIASQLTVGTDITGVLGADYKVGALTVRVWVEGWDQEAFNAILSGQISVALNFASKLA